MKAIIIAGISLFAAATIYGVTDFAADKKKGTIDKLYKEETPATAEKEIATAPVTANEESQTTAAATEAAAKKTTAKKKIRKAPKEEVRFIKAEDFSRGRIRPKEVKEDVIVEPVTVTKEKE